ncbi:hypothetical protein JCM8097_005260 [Rhodosporidiobolus ruineniae]
MARKHKRTSLFPLLPPAVLERIFAYDRASGSPRICKAASEPAHKALYHDVTLKTSTQLQRLCAALCSRPSLASYIKELTFENVERRWDVSYDSARRRIDVGLVQDLIATCGNLRYLCLVSGPLVIATLTASFFGLDPLRRLTSLDLELEHDEDYDHPAAACVLALLPQHVSMLKTLQLRGSGNNLPLDLLNLAPTAHLPPRSWQLEYLVLEGFLHVGPEFRNLVSALSFVSLASLVVRTHSVHPQFLADLAHLPPSLRGLKIHLGQPCPAYCSKHFSPKLDADSTAALFLPHLDLGAHLDLTLSSLLSLLPAKCIEATGEPYPQPRSPARPSALPNLILLSLDICNCSSISSAPSAV